MLKISFYCKYNRLGASSRIRFMQFLPKLSSFYQIQLNSLLSDEYITNLYAHRPQNKISILLAYCKRAHQLITDKSDLLVIEYELFPYIPYWVEKIFLRNKKYIIDIDDAVFHNYDLSMSWLKRFLLGDKFKFLFANSYAVLAGSPYLQDIAIKFGATNVLYYPTVIELDHYPLADNHENKNSNSIVIGWIGSDSTDKYLDIIKEPLQNFAKNSSCKIILHLVGSTRPLAIAGIEVINLPWTEASEVDLIKQFDIGIMPLADTLWERGKCAYKLIQYMACAKPVIASAVGANNVVVDQGINGFLCSNDQEWIDALVSLANNSTLRQDFGRAGRAKVVDNYTVDVNIKTLQNLLLKLSN